LVPTVCTPDWTSVTTNSNLPSRTGVLSPGVVEAGAGAAGGNGAADCNSTAALVCADAEGDACVALLELPASTPIPPHSTTMPPMTRRMIIPGPSFFFGAGGIG
jgi:hypothetical protein